jgi:ferric-dicitrate binding protein FerR (iron transport regulator)
MMKLSDEELQLLLARYLSGELTDQEKEFIESWIEESPENEAVFSGYISSWESVSLLHEMEQFNSFDALKKIDSRINPNKSVQWLLVMQRVAAILLLPLILYSVYITFDNKSAKSNNVDDVMQKVTTRPGMVTQFTLPDGTKVWLNSGSELVFPMHFTGNNREVQLNGEAFFEVVENAKKPFRVNANNLNIEVLGTSFNVVSYDYDSQAEVVLVHGKVALAFNKGSQVEKYGFLYPNQKAEFDRETLQFSKESVDVEKYTVWREGYLVFRDDNMDEVVKRLSRWFNVDIVLSNNELKSYTFQATFKNESLMQVLNLLKLSSPIDFKITERELLPDGEFTKQKVTIMKRK